MVSPHLKLCLAKRCRVPALGSHGWMDIWSFDILKWMVSPRCNPENSCGCGRAKSHDFSYIYNIVRKFSRPLSNDLVWSPPDEDFFYLLVCWLDLSIALKFLNLWKKIFACFLSSFFSPITYDGDFVLSLNWLDVFFRHLGNILFTSPPTITRGTVLHPGRHTNI